MKRGLSSTTYIKANKKRVSVLVVTIALFATMLYLVNYMMDPTYTSFKKLSYNQLGKQQFIRVNNITRYNNLDELLNEGVKRIQKEINVTDVFTAQYMSIPLTSIMGSYGVDMVLTSEDKVKELMDYYNAKLIEGRIPKTPGEIIVDSKLCTNNNVKIEDKINIEYTIVGIVESDYYFGTGISNQPNNCISILSEGKGVDYSIIAKEFGFDYVVYDSVQGIKNYKKDIVKTLDTTTMIITLGCLIILVICLIVVINMYYRDRHEEWCLYYSIGFSSQNIYFVTLREMLIIFGIGIVSSIFIIGTGVTIINLVMIKPQGLLAREILPKAINQILTSLFFVLGVCQIPLFYALNKIKTVDILEEE